MATHKKYPVDLKKSKLVIALAQLAGPLPDGKHKTVLNNRETLGWKSLDDMKSRLEKVYGVIDALSEVALKPDIVIFPEYSFPVENALLELQKRADNYGFIIIGGADNILQSKSSEIFNQSPIIIPKRKQPIWVTKRVVSQWEQGLVDAPAKPTQPLLTWEVAGRQYWISTQICLDFSLALENFKHGGGLILVPMCSPDVMSFLGWADGLLRLDRGTATVLCNCVGGFSKGQSGVVAVNADGKPFQAAFELSTMEEQVSIFEIDLLHLSPSKKTNPKQGYPLGRRFVYALKIKSEGVELSPLSKPPEVRKRGVINPAIFDVLGKKMRIAFLNVPQYADVEQKVKDKDYEVLAILGKEDLMVTHLAADSYDMIFDVAQGIDWLGPEEKIRSDEELDNMSEDDLPHFRVDTYYKVLGMPVSENDRSIFISRDKPFPTPEEITKIFKLGQKWEYPHISDEERRRFINNRWILDSTETIPGDINGIMTISILHARNESKTHRMKKFESDVIPKLLNDQQVTSLYRGVSHGVGIDYVLRLSINVKEKFKSLYDLIAEVHTFSKRARLIVDTTTYIVVKPLATISLSQAVLVVNIPTGLKLYRDRRIIPYLSNDDRVRLIYQTELVQTTFITQFQPVDQALEQINYLDREAEAKRVLLQNLTRGLLNENFEQLKEVHDPLLTQVERRLAEFIKLEISDAEFDQVKVRSKTKERSIPSQKTKAQLSYTERITAIICYIEETSNHSEFLPVVASLEPTTKARNAFAHNEWERISIKEALDTLIAYCKFIYIWMVTFRKEDSHETPETENDFSADTLTEEEV